MAKKEKELKTYIATMGKSDYTKGVYLANAKGKKQAIKKIKRDFKDATTVYEIRPVNNKRAVEVEKKVYIPNNPPGTAHERIATEQMKKNKSQMGEL